jgi:phenylacetate-CoA ligase
MPHLDALETRPHADRLADQLTRLSAQLQWAHDSSPAYRALLAGIDLAAVNTLAALATLPVTRKSALIAEQAAQPPFGGYAALATGAAARVFASPGPIYEPQGLGDDFWRLSRALYAAGFRAGDVVHNTFSYHFTPGGFMLDSGARALGCAVFPAGVGQTEQQVMAMRDIGATAYTGTPSFLKIILEKADSMGVPLPALRKALVTGEALPASLRDWFTARGIAVRQCYATADLGLIAYETEPNAGLIIDEGILLEIVTPGSGDPVAEGAVGEVLVTSFNTAYPLVRFATGDLSAFAVGSSACGRTNRRIKGWMGRADQTAKIKGMFVHPEQLHALTRRYPALGRVRLVVERVNDLDVMTLLAESNHDDATLAALVGESLRELTKLKGSVTLVAPTSLPNDGKVIDDRRPIA